MLTNTVGPQMVGATDLRSLSEKDRAKDFRASDSSSSFEKALQDKLQSKISRERESETREPKKETVRESSNRPTKEKTMSEEKVAKLKGPKNKSGSRQQAIKEFMDSFESEFQRPPTRLVEAIAKLDDNQLQESPEITADAVIDKLDLDESQSEKARAMYVSLLMQLQQSSAFPLSRFGQDSHFISNTFGDFNYENGMNEETKLSSINQDQWVNGQSALKSFGTGETAENLEIDQEGQTEPLDDQVQNDGVDEFNANLDIKSERPASMEGLPPHVRGQMNESIGPELMTVLAARKAQSAQILSTDSPGRMSTTGEEPALDRRLIALDGVAKKQSATREDLATSEHNTSEPSKIQNQDTTRHFRDLEQSSMNLGKHSNKGSGKDSEGNKDDVLKSKLIDSDGNVRSNSATEPLNFSEVTPMASTIPQHVGEKDGSENQAAIKQLMNQAQYLIKKGGGEVKVELNREGLGNIQLKVLLQDGKVHLQMSAETPEAKSTLESSLVDLKNSLAAQKLSVENVRVDLVNTTSADTATKNQSQTNSQGHGQGDQNQARQFWNQFNDNFGNQSRRESMIEFQNSKSYLGKKNGPRPLQAIETASSSIRGSSSLAGTGRGLNIVA